MGLSNKKTYNTILQLSIVGLTWALVWFSFVYYPKIISQYKTKAPSQTIFKPVSADSKNFPIQTSAYRIVYEEESQTYYAFIEGTTLDTFEFNRQNAKLALKTALSTQNLCMTNVLYISTQDIKVPQNLTGNSDC